MIDAQTQAFYDKTRLKYSKLGTITKPTGGGSSPALQIPRTGLLQGIRLQITATVAGTLSNLNPLGAASIIRRVRLLVNSSNDLFSVSGAGYAYLLNEAIASELALAIGATYNQGRSVVSAATFRLDMYIPVSMNQRDSIGLFMLQNNQTTVELYIDWEADANVATGATITGTCVPTIEFLIVPATGELPPLNLIHQCIEDSVGVVAGDYHYQPTQGQVYLQVLHGAALAQANTTDQFTRFRQVIAQSDYWMDETPETLDDLNYVQRGRNRLKGNILIDFAATSGLGVFGLPRDWFDTKWTTDYEHIITFGGSTTLTTIRRQLVRVGG
jgi:hypothetical protein